MPAAKKVKVVSVDQSSGQVDDAAANQEVIASVEPVDAPESMFGQNDLFEITEYNFIEFFKSNPEFNYKEGVSPDSFSVTIDENLYHNATKDFAVSSTSLKVINRSLAHYKAGNKGETDAMTFGTLAHTAVLEPHKMSKYVVWTGGRRFGKKWDEFCAANADKEIVLQEDYDDAVELAKSVRSCNGGVLDGILNGGVKELSIFYKDDKSGLWCKIRPDLLNIEYGIFDLKSTVDAREDTFLRHCIKFDYYLSAAMYTEGVYRYLGAELGFVLIAVEKSGPFALKPYTIVNDDLARGKARYEKALASLAKAKQTNQWPAYPFELIEARHPAYYKD